MRAKFKAVGIGVLAVAALAVLAAANASATGGGLFHADPHSRLVIATGGTHNLHFSNHGLSGEFGCTTTAYEGTTSSSTVSSIILIPTYAGCTTTGTETTVPIDMNGCSYTFTVAAGTTDSTEQTVHLTCPAGQSVKITHPNCTMTIHPQTLNTGTTYTTQTNSQTGKHEITLHTRVQFSTTRHGLCQFVAPTNGTATLNGSVTLRAVDTVGNQVHLTAT